MVYQSPMIKNIALYVFSFAFISMAAFAAPASRITCDVFEGLNPTETSGSPEPLKYTMSYDLSVSGGINTGQIKARVLNATMGVDTFVSTSTPGRQVVIVTSRDIASGVTVPASGASETRLFLDTREGGLSINCLTK